MSSAYSVPGEHEPPRVNPKQNEFSHSGSLPKKRNRVNSIKKQVKHYMLGGWVNPHREQQTIPQGQTSKPAQIFPHANGQSAPGKAALATFAGAPGATHRARPRSPVTHTHTTRTTQHTKRTTPQHERFIRSCRAHLTRTSPLHFGLTLGLYTILSSPIVYGVWDTKGGSVGGRILRNGRAIVIQ